MRLGRRASLLVAFYLLTSTATANAECAWVLWEEIFLVTAAQDYFMSRGWDDLVSESETGAGVEPRAVHTQLVETLVRSDAALSAA